jgi:aminoglycoside phosphotransferase (APT) family kinase protein
MCANLSLSGSTQPDIEGMTMLDDFGGVMRWDNIQQWIDSRGDIPGRGPITGVQQMQGGSQNLLFLLERGEEKMVLRRPPQHLRDNSNKTMVREATVLVALVGSDVPHAELFGLCDDAEVTGACFYLMKPLEGYSPKGPLPGRYAENPEWRRAMGEQLVRASAALASVDHVAAGLSDFGKPDDWHARQIDRWRSQLEGYRSYRGYDTGELGRVDAIARWLGDNLPNERLGIVDLGRSDARSGMDADELDRAWGSGGARADGNTMARFHDPKRLDYPLLRAYPTQFG